MVDRLFLSLRCRSLWEGPLPVAPSDFLLRLPAELDRLRGNGATLVEFKAEACALDKRYCDPEIWKRVANCVRDNGLGATVHLPAAWVDLAAFDHEVWEGSVRSVEAALHATAPLRPWVATVHPGGDATGEWIRGLPETDRQAATQLALERVVEALRRLRALQEADPLALENLEGAGCDLIASAAKRANVDVCLDVGHVVSNGEGLVEALNAVSPRLRGIHLHDAKPPAMAGGKGQAHLPLGAGVLDLEMFITELLERSFKGPVILEVRGDPSSSARRFFDTVRSVT